MTNASPDKPRHKKKYADRLAGLSPAKRAFLESRLRGEFTASSQSHIISSRPDQKVFPLSYAQQRMWFLCLLEPGNPSYNCPVFIRLTGRPNTATLKRCLNEIIRRHEVLRATFQTVDGQPLQLIAPSMPLELPVVNLSDLPDTEQDLEVQRLVTDEVQWSFDIAQGPLLRATLLRLSEAEHLLLLVMHHITFDGWSAGVLISEIAAFYEALSMGKPALLPELPIQYADFAHWQRQWLQDEFLKNQITYWKQQLGGSLQVLELPTDRPRPAVQTYRGAQQSLMLSNKLTEALKSLSRQEEVTLFMTLLAVFQTLLHRYTGQDDIIVGSPIAGRNRVETEKLIGVFINTLALRTDFSDNPSFRKLLRRVREMTLWAYSNQDLPFEKLVEELQPERDLSRNPLFQVMFILQNTPRPAIELPGLTVSLFEIDSGWSQFDLTLELQETSEGLRGWFEYNTDLFESTAIARMANHFQTLLEGVVANPNQDISDLSLLAKSERQKLLLDWNDTKTKYPEDECIHQLFEIQAVRTPDAIAVVFEDEQLTYQELNRRANQLAHHLCGLGLGSGALVGIFMERAPDMFIGLLGILKAGGAYVPLDPASPKERLAFMLQDSKVSVLLTQQRLIGCLPEHEARVVCLDTSWETIDLKSEENPVSRATAETPAYVIYTSGSTGKPKGVLGPHRGAVNRFNWMWKTYPFEVGEVCCQKTSLSFVDSVWEIFGPLLQGIPTLIIPDEILKDPHRLVSTLAAYHITRIVLVPSMIRVILDTYDDLENRLPALKFWVTSGEAFSIELYRRFLKVMPQSVLINLYGSTEVSADSTWYESSRNKSLPCVPIGRPIANTQVYILDTHLQPVPIGMQGELYISGDGLAHGYLNRPELTEKAFISNPFCDKPDSRLYKTGDLGRWLVDGDIEFLGRIDHQVKIRGFRIELGEVETVLSQHPDVHETVVTACEDRPDEKRLVAYFVSSRKQTPTIDALRCYLKQKLPDYMVPSAFVLLDALPLMPNGKVDRCALPRPNEVRQESAESSVKPRDELELQLSKIWEKVLSIKNVGMKDNFFDLGGHSLLAVLLFAQIQKIFGKDLPLTTLLQAPTVEQLAGVLRQKGWSSPCFSLVPMQHSGARPPFFCTHGCGGIVFHMQGLARHLFPEQPFYGLKAQGLEKGQAPHTRIEDMAALYIKEIQTIQPDGPYFIGSTGHGGAIGLEVAQQLKSQGQNVGLLVLINPVTLQPNLSHFSFIRGIYGESLKYFFHRLVDFMHNRPLLPYVKYTFFNRVLVNWRIFQRFVPMNIQREYRFRDAIRNALLNYTPHVYPGRITCFLCEKFHSNPQKRIGDWYDIAGGGLDVGFVPGTIEGMWRKPHVQKLAEELKTCLDEAMTNG